MVTVPTVMFGKTQSGKTFRAYERFRAHEGPAIFCDIQWRRFQVGIECTEVDQVIQVLQEWTEGPPPKITWLPRDYSQLESLVSYLLETHRARHLEGVALPDLALFMDEVSLAAPRGAVDSLPAVRVFTQGYQHRVIGVAITQWTAQFHKMIVTNGVDFYIYNLNEGDYHLLEQNYKIEVPDPNWSEYGTYRYWRYDGEWWKGNPDGTETRYGGKENGDKEEDEEEVEQVQGESESGEQPSPVGGSDDRSGSEEGATDGSEGGSGSDIGRPPEGHRIIKGLK